MLCATIPRGKITTYKAIAQKIGTASYRAVGQALRRNPYAPVVPCHRVICSDGRIGGFKVKTAGKEIQEKTQLLKQEGIKISDGKIDLEHYFFSV